MTTQTYAILYTKDISALGKVKASGCAVLLYSALLSYARDKVSAFPSIATLSKAIGGAYSETGIYKALKFLEDHKFIKRNDRRSKQRFVMLRKMAKATLTKVNATLCTSKVKRNRKKENYSFYKRRHKKNVSPGLSANKSKQADKPKVPDAERIFETWAIQNPSRDVKAFTNDEIRTIGAYLRSHTNQAIEFRELMWEHWSKEFIEIKRITAPVS